MRSAESVLWLNDHRQPPVVPVLPTPKSFSTKPAVFAPHPALVSGGWYQGVDQEVLGPGRYPVRCPNDKTAASALLWTFFFGPLGLCYLSTALGIAASAVGAGILVISGSVAALAVIWPLAMVLALLTAPRR